MDMKEISERIIVEFNRVFKDDGISAAVKWLDRYEARHFVKASEIVEICDFLMNTDLFVSYMNSLSDPPAFWKRYISASLERHSGELLNGSLPTSPFVKKKARDTLRALKSRADADMITLSDTASGRQMQVDVPEGHISDIDMFKVLSCLIGQMPDCSIHFETKKTRQ